MRDKPVEITMELVNLYGFSLLEDPDRLGQLLEDKCGDCRQEIFILTFALRELSRGGRLPSASALTDGAAEIEARLRENLGFSEEIAIWAVSSIAAILGSGSGSAYSEPVHVEARRGFLTGASAVLSPKPRTGPLRRTALRNGLLLLGILLIFLGLFFRIALARFPMSGEHRLVFLAHLSGPAAAAGHVRLKAAQLAADQINALGGVKGSAIHLEGRDLSYNPSQAVAVVKDLLRDKKIIAMISACEDDVNRAVAELADAEELPLIATESSDAAVTMLNSDKPRLYSFRTNYDRAYEGRMLAYFLIRGLAGRPAVLLYDPSDARSQEIRDSFLKSMGTLELIGEAFYSSHGLAKGALSLVLDLKAEVVVIANPAADITGVVANLREGGYSASILGLAYDGAMQDALGRDLDNSWWIVPAAQEDPQLQSFQTSYRNKYNESSSRGDLVGAILAYDSLRWIADAIYRAPGYQGEALRHALLSTKNLALTHATLTLDPRTHGPWNKAAALVFCSDGRGRFQKRFLPH